MSEQHVQPCLWCIWYKIAFFHLGSILTYEVIWYIIGTIAGICVLICCCKICSEAGKEDDSPNTSIDDHYQHQQRNINIPTNYPETKDQFQDNIHQSSNHATNSSTDNFSHPISPIDVHSNEQNPPAMSDSLPNYASLGYENYNFKPDDNIQSGTILSPNNLPYSPTPVTGPLAPVTGPPPYPTNQSGGWVDPYQNNHL